MFSPLQTVKGLKVVGWLRSNWSTYTNVSNSKQRRQDSVVSFDQIKQSHQKNKAPMFSISLVPPVKSIHSILQKKTVEKERQNKQKCPESWWMLKSAIWQNQEPYYVQDAFYIGKPKAREPKLSRKWNPMQTLPLCTYSIFLCFLLITILILAQCKYFSQSSRKRKKKQPAQKSVPKSLC